MATKKTSYLGPPAGAPAAPEAPERRSYFSSTIGMKVLMAVTGLLLAVYLILHLLGNLLIYVGPATFNTYGYLLVTNPLIIPVEIGLLAIFVVHVYEAIVNWLMNRRARPVQYYHAGRRLFGYGWAGRPSRKSLASTSMILSGPIILLFIIVHVSQFKYGAYYTVTSAAYGAPGIRDLYRLELQNFSNGFIVAFYVFCLVAIGLHLWHGLSSALNSLGRSHSGSSSFYGGR
jgi:succinate dehydrogenase / fumarate reductase cytochrome b subunit